MGEISIAADRDSVAKESVRLSPTCAVSVNACGPNGSQESSGKRLQALTPGRFRHLCKILPTGSLEARKSTNGSIRLYWRYFHGGKQSRELIGLYDARLPPKSLQPTADGRYSIAAAARRAEDMASQHLASRHEGGYPGLIATKRAVEEQQHEASDPKPDETLAALIDEYCDYLTAKNRSSHREVRNALSLHVKQANPECAAKPARDLQDEDIADLLRPMFAAEIERQANKVRAYLHAAYALALKARTNAKLPSGLKRFNIRSNPVSTTATNPEFNRNAKNPLSQAELVTYWNLIKGLDGMKGIALRLHLLVGGQRIQQLARLLSKDVQKDRILLWDTKGPPGKDPRRIDLPLVGLARDLSKSIDLSGRYALTSDGGRSPICNTTLSAWATEVVGDRIDNFKLKRVRSGVETLLASRQVPKDYRGRLQSHGIGGVQDAAYDGYDYMWEKEQALRTLHDALDGDIGGSSARSVRPPISAPVAPGGATGRPQLRLVSSNQARKATGS